MADKEDAVVDEAAARAWWAARELRAEAELSAVLQKRVEAQRAQTLAFKTEQSKWEHELQLRLAKYAHDRKLLTEHNVEMQEQLRALQEQLARQQREMDVQVMRVIELEATASDGRIDAQHAQSLQIRCESLEKQVLQWEHLYRSERTAAGELQQQQQEELLQYLEQALQTKLERPPSISTPHSSHGSASSDLRTRGQRSLPRTTSWSAGSARITTRSSGTKEQSNAPRIADLEKACKQKDQAIHALKTLLERQEAVSDEKLKVMSAKYEQVKTINLALQTQLLSVLTDLEEKP